MNIEKFMLCEISDMDDYVGDFVISEILDSCILTYPVTRLEYADEAVLSTGIRAYSESNGAIIIIDILSPMRFFTSQVSALLEKIPADVAAILTAYKTEHLARTALRKRQLNAA